MFINILIMSFAFNIFNKILNCKSKYKSVDFFTKNETRILIWLLSVTRFDEKIIKNFSFYYKNIPLKISSQINVNNQIDLALENNFLEKKKSDIDKRSIIITATEKTVKEFNIFVNDIK